jgi:photoactive yellow protein
MMSLTIPYGLFELDEAGTVVHYSPPTEKNKNGLPDGVVGRNFFREIAPLPELHALKSRFLSFMAFGDSVERFSVSFAHGQEVIKIQIALARVTERSEVGSKRFALVRLMPDASFS